ncbi:heptaprenyl diphosphate synthase subunit II [Alkalihalobacillus alcalophilus ATCC 27647 = CGMCC 1.3604]|uniref:Heptaprenyl diphosphate synthase component 2 n=1 Tax=Alkalihalobacillus alcalophilus ATCC 27647 = CGMCC 1.3604 TaxID=1218173 RepID=A0A094WQS2_ALKAL|nr:heptaprenyl diphosphate synthase component II [Alkalihalobacillus alcalophilus]KGA99146.1 heptaprenyl diphosphate synthase [Alkalihalobacillus alcalophilus ATCC 27647 = CGMCC 1.3604]MED1560493.1 heptaprenyl diphosphate synthase component II [Alkalihalobacillus alcalophilus]THG92032.1 heptaprenyl diphosphate synthase subunit II [Alkalihalobacillus alcalophilus ATCC 27647 = CGMCC 1.3604]
MNLADIYINYKEDIKTIERELEKNVQTANPILEDASVHLLRAGGKRIRPVFVLLAAKFGEYDIEKLKHIAVPLELIHMGSLVHDDVIDDAELRRGEKTVKSQWDNRVAMYTGDFIFGKAVETSAIFVNPSIHEIMSNAMVEICLGEIEQIRDQYNWEQNMRHYLRRIKRKTALLIAISSQLGAIASKADPDVQKQLYWFGYYVGMSFQITDDILDFIGTEKQLGKPAGGDLLQGNVTLPALYALTKKPQLKAELNDFFNGSNQDKEHFHKFLEVIKRSGGIEYATKMSDLYLKKAFERLDLLPNIKAKQHLSDIATYIGRRKF